MSPLALAQSAIFHATRPHHWYGHFAAADHERFGALARGVRAIQSSCVSHDVSVVIGFGSEIWKGIEPDGRVEPGLLHPLEPITGKRAMVATQEDVFIWLQADGSDRIIAVLIEMAGSLRNVATLKRETTGFVYLDSRDLTGFIDGTANPGLEEAPDVALVSDGPGAGGSYILGQKWRHDLSAFHALSVGEQERVIGRKKADSAELDDAPADAHIKRVELHDAGGEELPIFRRSTPWANYMEQGLYFLAFAKEPARFVTMLEIMFGAGPDGVPDRLTEFSTPVSGAIYWAPPQAFLDAFTR